MVDCLFDWLIDESEGLMNVQLWQSLWYKVFVQLSELLVHVNWCPFQSIRSQSHTSINSINHISLITLAHWIIQSNQSTYTNHIDSFDEQTKYRCKHNLIEISCAIRYRSDRLNHWEVMDEHFEHDEIMISGLIKHDGHRGR